MELLRRNAFHVVKKLWQGKNPKFPRSGSGTALISLGAEMFLSSVLGNTEDETSGPSQDQTPNT